MFFNDKPEEGIGKRVIDKHTVKPHRIWTDGINGNARLYMRSDTETPVWQVQYKLDGKWGKRISTGQSDFIEAQDFAIQKYYEIIYGQANGKTASKKTFKSVAHMVEKKGKLKRQSSLALEKYVEFFDAKFINEITEDDLYMFDKWLIEKEGRKSRSTLVNYNKALEGCFDFAEKKGWIQKNEMPELHNDGYESEEDAPKFRHSDIKWILKTLPKYIKEREKQKDFPELLLDVIQFMLASGCRPGKEVMLLEYKDLTEHFNPKQIEARITSWKKIRPGKKIERRRCGLPPQIKDTILRVANRFPELRGKSINELKKEFSRVRVFRLPNGETPDLIGTFRNFLKKYNKRIDPETGLPFRLYSIRHFYLNTQANKRNINIFKLAESTGTSIEMLREFYVKSNTLRDSNFIIPLIAF